VWCEERYIPEFSWGNFRERDNLKDVGADEIIILKWTFKRLGWDHAKK
jgi:hypothetical protein